MKKYIVFPLLLFMLSVPVYAQTDNSQADITAFDVEEITMEDLGIPDPGLLPTNPFYFLKEWGRGVRQIFTFNAVKKARLELRFTNEKVAELKKLEEIDPEDEEAIEKALVNYQESQVRLKVRFENIKENSENPNVERLLEEFVDRAVKHTKVFDSIISRFRDKENVLELANDVREEIGEVVALAAEKDEPAKFAAKLERVFITERGSELKHIRSLEMLDRFSQKVSEDVRDSLERLRHDFSERLEGDIDEAIKKHGEKVVQDVIRNLPGDDVRRANILSEIKERASFRVSNAIGGVAKEYSDRVLDDKNIKEKALEQIESTSKFLAHLERKINEAQVTIPQSVQNHLDKARTSLQRAKQAWSEEKYGEAFGHTRAAESVIRSALRTFEEERPQTVDLEQELKRLADTLNKYKELIEERDFSEKEVAKELLEEARKHLGLAKEALSVEDLKGTVTHMSRVKEFIQKISRLIESDVRAEHNVPTLDSVAPALRARAVSVCERFAKNMEELKRLRGAGEIKDEDYERKMEILNKELRLCRESRGINTTVSTAPLQKPIRPLPIITPSDKPVIESAGVPTIAPVGSVESINVICTAQYDPICGSNGRTYSNACRAKVAGITVKHRGACEIRENIELKECGVKPLLSAPPAGCKYDGPRCAEGGWKYKLVCLETETKTEPSSDSGSSLDSTNIAPTPTSSTDLNIY